MMRERYSSLSGSAAVVAALLVISVLTFSCGEEESSETPPGGHEGGSGGSGGMPALGRTDLCVEAFVPNGFGVAWKNLNHRIALLDVAFDPSAATECSSDPKALLLARFIGGDFTTGEVATDEPIARASYASIGPHEAGTVGEPAVHVEQGEVELALDLSQEASVPLPELPLKPGFESASVIALSGLELNTDIPQSAEYPAEYDPSLGYTTKGIDAELLPAEGPVEGRMAFRLAIADRAQMNAAIPFAQTAAKLRYMRIGLTDGKVTHAVKSISHTYDPGEPLDATPLPALDDSLTALSIEGEPGYEHATVVLTGYRLDLFKSAEHGDYIRELSVRARNIQYDQETGNADLNVDVYVSNAGLFTENAMELDAEVSVALLQWNGGGEVVHLESSESFSVSRDVTRIALPLDFAEP